MLLAFAEFLDVCKIKWPHLWHFDDNSFGKALQALVADKVSLLKNVPWLPRSFLWKDAKLGCCSPEVIRVLCSKEAFFISFAYV